MSLKKKLFGFERCFVRFQQGENLIKCPSAVILTIIFCGLPGSMFAPVCVCVMETKTKARLGCVRVDLFE